MLGFLKQTEKPIRYTYGLEYRNPTVCCMPMTHEKAVAMFAKTGMDVLEAKTYIVLNNYIDNDLW